MPGRGAGRGRGKPLEKNPPPQLTPQQLAKLSGNVQGQFDDCPSSSSNEVKQPTPTKEQSSTSHTAPVTSKTTPIKTPSSDNKLSPKPAVSNTSSPSTNVTPKKPGLNVDAQEFIPFGAEATPNLDPNNEFDINNVMTVESILSSFERRTKGDKILLTATATMLLEVSSFPGTFDTHAQVLTSIVRGNKDIMDDELCDIADMLLHWGVNGDTSLRYNSVRIVDLLCQTEIRDKFRTKLFQFLQKLYKKQKATNHKTVEEKDQLMDLTLFVAEMFYRIRLIIVKSKKRETIRVLGDALFELMHKLVLCDDEPTMLCVCNTLKLTGSLLDQLETKQDFDPKIKMDNLLSLLRSRVASATTSQQMGSVLINVLTARAANWGKGPPMANNQQQAQGNHVTPPTSPSAQDWQQYTDEWGNVIEGEEDEPFMLGAQQDPEADDELIREYESFVQEFEDHLLMKEFGQQNP